MLKHIQRLFSRGSELPLSLEQTGLIDEIHQARYKLEHAWQNFRYAHPEYIDIAVMEINNAESEYGLLSRKLRLLRAEEQVMDVPSFSDNPRSQFAWLRQKHNVGLY